MKTITLLHPSRGRAILAKVTFDVWLDKISKENRIQHILSIDEDDHQRPYYESCFTESLIVVEKNENLVQASNAGAKGAIGDIIVLISDDFLCPQNWDKLIVDAIGERESAVLKTFDGVQKWIVTLPIMTRKYYESQGYFYYPEYQHMFCDTDMTHKAELEGKLIVRNDLVFKHDHYTTGKRPKDYTNERADSTWDKGKDVYLKRVFNGFGLEKYPNPLELCLDAREHVAWINNEMNSKINAMFNACDMPGYANLPVDAKITHLNGNR